MQKLETSYTRHQHFKKSLNYHTIAKTVRNLSQISNVLSSFANNSTKYIVGKKNL